MRAIETSVKAIAGAILLTALGSAAKADDMAYMINVQSQFGIIDLNTGDFSPVGTSSIPSYVPVGLGVAGGKLYTAGYTASTLYQVNPASGALTAVGSSSIKYYGLGSTTSGLYALATYVSSNNGTVFNLYSIDPSSGAATLVGPVGPIGPSPAWSLSTGSSTLYLADNFNLYSLNTSTGAATLIGSPPATSLNSAALVYENGTLYAGVDSCNPSCNISVWSLSTANGAGTLVSSATNTSYFQGLAPIVPPSTQQILAQFAFGGGWYSALYFTNTSTSEVSFTVNFIGDDGNAMNVVGIGGSTNVSLAPRGTAIIEAPNFGALTQGYVSVALPGGVTGYGVFRQSVPGIADQEAVVSLSPVSVSSSTLIFDDTEYITSVAIANPSSVQATVSITAWDSSGNILGTSSLTLAPRTKMEGALHSFPGLGGVVGNRGSAAFVAGSGNIVVLGLRFNGAAITSIPTAGQ